MFVVGHRGSYIQWPYPLSLCAQLMCICHTFILFWLIESKVFPNNRWGMETDIIILATSFSELQKRFDWRLCRVLVFKNILHEYALTVKSRYGLLLSTFHNGKSPLLGGCGSTLNMSLFICKIVSCFFLSKTFSCELK